MKKSQTALFLTLFMFSPCHCFGQGMVEMGGTHASAMGLGTGLSSGGLNHGHAVGRSYQSAAASLSAASASLNHGQGISRHSYQAAMRASGAAINQSNVIAQYMKIGSGFEAKKRWAEAEESYKYVLRVIASRDGPGSVQSVPVLEHLVAVTQAQDKLNDAISLQKTVLNFKKAASNQNFGEIISAQNNLSGLYERRGDYGSAEPLLKDSMAICDTHQTVVSADRRHATVTSYAKILRKLKKDGEADAIENSEKKELTNETIVPAVKNESIED